MSENWDHLGGKEVRDGQTTQFSANWERGASSIDSSTLSSMSEVDASASDAEPWEASAEALFGDAGVIKYIENVFVSWNGTNETERTFFDSNGAQLGDSRTNIDTWNNGTTDVTNTNTNYHDANGEWLGNEYSNDQGEAGYMFTRTVEKYETGTTDLTTAWTALATDFSWLLASGETAINFTYDDGQGNTVEITTIKVESGSNTYTIGEGSAATTVTETREHLMSENWDHLGGKEVRDGETIQWSANWERGAATFDVSGSTGIDQSFCIQCFR